MLVVCIFGAFLMGSYNHEMNRADSLVSMYVDDDEVMRYDDWWSPAVARANLLAGFVGDWFSSSCVAAPAWDINFHV